ncbi:hypothetical protein ALNOE001_01760 [Candidatus Methanobinarius endosymbioticus]|uniref:Uncharacterized protein n=1 Tax=Candidatus Methanobinarius endosymbioticus TaxID=2006182 RepID=A0A366MFY8_9EURY|nr:hypothetical protein ALNOE001_01760 [Candidatus Methanobinarius endosymbioticus]
MKADSVETRIYGNILFNDENELNEILDKNLKLNIITDDGTVKNCIIIDTNGKFTGINGKYY